ncbi:hypothetical protein GGS24DRAFT_445673 [Hypoxylon argillaceum]|nr:hypothetical protein GGS24DRAFT_445673 [Hypoxylon argillaceum]
MALELVAGHAFSNLGFTNILPARDLTASSIVQARADSNDTVNIFIDSTDADIVDYEYAASVVNACESYTVYALQCTSGPSDICGSNLPAVTITENPSSYRVSSSVSTQTAGVEVKVTVVENCALDGSTAATCTATVAGSADGTKYTTSATAVYTDAATLRYDVAITAGAEKLANPTGKCSAAAPGASARGVALWGLLGAVGAAGVLAL